MKNLYLLIDVGSKVTRVAHVTNDMVKAKHWQELLLDQGMDAKVVLLESDLIDCIDSLKGED